MTSKTSPIVLVKDNPLTVFSIRTGRTNPITTVTAGNVRLTNQTVVFRTCRYTCNVPTRSGITVPVTDGINLDEVIFIAHDEHVTVVSVRQEVVCLVSLSQDGWVGRTVGNDVHVTCSHDGTFVKVIPILVHTRCIWSIGHTWVSITIQADVSIGWVENFEELVVACSFSVAAEEEPTSRCITWQQGWLNVLAVAVIICCFSVVVTRLRILTTRNFEFITNAITIAVAQASTITTVELLSKEA